MDVYAVGEQGMCRRSNSMWPDSVKAFNEKTFLVLYKAQELDARGAEPVDKDEAYLSTHALTFLGQLHYLISYINLSFPHDDRSPFSKSLKNELGIQASWFPRISCAHGMSRCAC